MLRFYWYCTKVELSTFNIPHLELTDCRIIKTDGGAGVKVRACASSDGPPDGCWVRETA